MHKHLIALAGVLALVATSSSSAMAAWGCGANSPKGDWADTWNKPSEAEARTAALATCGKTCRIVACRSDIDTMAQADALWRPANSQVTKCAPGEVVDASSPTGCGRK